MYNTKLQFTKRVLLTYISIGFGLDDVETIVGESPRTSPLASNQLVGIRSATTGTIVSYQLA